MKFRYLAICTLAVVLCTIAHAQQGNIPVPGTITGVTAGTDLTGGGTSGNVTLNLDTTKVPRLKTANTFTGNQTVTGNVSASGTVNGASYLIGGAPFAFGSATGYNAFLGFAGNSATNTGIENTAVGVTSLENNTTGSSNTSIGNFALQDNTTGGNNTALGYVTEFATQAGSYDTYLGMFATSDYDVTNATVIGAVTLVEQSNTVILGGTNESIPGASVTVGIGTSTPYSDYALDIETVNSNGIINGGVVVNATGGNLYLGMTNTVHKFRIDTNGAVYADGGLFASGADFAESVEVRGDRAQYEPGDVLAIDPGAKRHFAFSHHSYETLVAGIYSTKPGVLASPHHIDDPSIQTGEVPLAVVGIVPCKVTAENGAIQRGDLLVTSSRPGYAMKGTDRKRLVGAVVGKAMEPLSAGTGKIQVLVTLQ